MSRGAKLSAPQEECARRCALQFRHSLITFGGLDGAGKSTQLAMLRSRLHARGVETAVVWVRGGYTPLFCDMKAALRRIAPGWLPPPGAGERRSAALGRPGRRRLWLAAALLDLLFLLAVRVRWLRRRRVVLCDRYLLDTLVDFRLNFPGDDVEHWWLWRALERLALRPDVAFVLLVPVAESRRRSDIKGEPFRDSPAVLAERLVHYRALAAPDRFTVLDGSRSVTEIADTIGAALGLPPARNDAHQPAA